MLPTMAGNAYAEALPHTIRLLRR